MRPRARARYIYLLRCPVSISAADSSRRTVSGPLAPFAYRARAPPTSAILIQIPRARANPEQIMNIKLFQLTGESGGALEVATSGDAR